MNVFFFFNTILAWHSLFQSAKKSILSGEYYFTLTSGGGYPPIYQGNQGQTIFQVKELVLFFNLIFGSKKKNEKDFIDAYKQRGVSIQIVQNQPDQNYPANETEYLAAHAGAKVLSINFPKLVGAGILHTKMILFDGYKRMICHFVFF